MRETLGTRLTPHHTLNEERSACFTAQPLSALLHAAILRPPAKRIQIKLYEPHLGKEKPVMGNIEPLLGITKPAEGLNKPCQGNVNGRKSFAAENTVH